MRAFNRHGRVKNLNLTPASTDVSWKMPRLEILVSVIFDMILKVEC